MFFVSTRSTSLSLSPLYLTYRKQVFGPNPSIFSSYLATLTLSATLYLHLPKCLTLGGRSSLSAYLAMEGPPT